MISTWMAECLCLGFYLSGCGYLTLAGKTCLEKGRGGTQQMTQRFQFGRFKRNIFRPSMSAELRGEATHTVCSLSYTVYTHARTQYTYSTYSSKYRQYWQWRHSYSLTKHLQTKIPTRTVKNRNGRVILQHPVLHQFCQGGAGGMTRTWQDRELNQPFTIQE